MKRKWYIDTLKKEAAKYKTRSDFMRGNYGAYLAAKRWGLMEEICRHMPKHMDQSGENNPRFKWTVKLIKLEAIKYTKISDFIEKSHGAYKAAKRLDILNVICSHMSKQRYDGKNNPNFKWTEEILTKIA